VRPIHTAHSLDAAERARRPRRSTLAGSASAPAIARAHARDEADHAGDREDERGRTEEGHPKPGGVARGAKPELARLGGERQIGGPVRVEAGWPISCLGDPTTVMGLPMQRLAGWINRARLRI
jgi:hypothetical protein